MSEATSIPFAVVFGIITILLIRSRDVKFWEAVAIGLFGLYVGQTPLVYTIGGLVNWVFSGFQHT
ncbi:hypothetical protein ADK76_31760 [Streptomyces griseoflavus]|uniref:hypothetical protein n=1 Tax=Streptomyces TaxID=1883 RepID=UPI0004C7BAA7|nr:hypothetical protein [Streptomyces rimosus]KOG52491.1 hypothetical protein ADK76_31760 [Streptomyces griseoflavus]